MDLSLPSLGIVVPAAPCLFHAKRHQIYERFDLDHMVLAGELNWYHTHRQIHTGKQWPIDWHTHTNINLYHLLYGHSSYMFFNEWLTCWYKKLPYNVFAIQNYSLVEVIYLLIRFSKNMSFPRNKKNTNRNGINLQNTLITHAKKDKFLKGLVIVN